MHRGKRINEYLSLFSPLKSYLHLCEISQGEARQTVFSVTTNEQKTQMKKPHWTVGVSMQHSKPPSPTISLSQSFYDGFKNKKQVKIHCLPSIKWSDNLRIIQHTLIS